MDPSIVAVGMIWYVVFLLSLTCHEAAHAYAALRGGDATAYEGGQVTLDPIPHMRREPFGTIFVPLLSYGFMGWMFGWASTPIDPHWAAHHPRKAAYVSLAGPFANLVLLVLAAVAIRALIQVGVLAPPDLGALRLDAIASSPDGSLRGLATFLSILFSLNLLLFVLNLLPIPPLDGSGTFPLFMNETRALELQGMMRQPIPSLIGILIAFRLIPYVFEPAFLFSLDVLYAGL